MFHQWNNSNYPGICPTGAPAVQADFHRGSGPADDDESSVLSESSDDDAPPDQQG